MSNEFEYDVFLSYSSKDRGIVHALAKRLKEDGLRVWLDAWAIQPGDSIPLKIQHGLEQSRTLLMCMSPAYFASDWGTLEHNTLLFRDPTNAQRRFIPLLIEDCVLPDIIGQFAYIDLRTSFEEAYARLLTACHVEEEELSETLVQEKQDGQAWMVLGANAHTEGILNTAITPDGETIVSASSDRTLKIWDLATGKCKATFEGHTGAVMGVAVTPYGQTIVSASSDSTLKIWDLATGKCEATLKGHADAVWGMAVTHDGGTIVSASEDRTLKVWDLAMGKCKATLSGHANAVWAVALTPDGKTIVSASDDRTLMEWDLATGKCKATLEGHAGAVRGVAVTPDGRTIVSASIDRTLKIWDLATGKCKATLEGHADAVLGVAVTLDGKTIVSALYDRTLKIWDLATGKCKATLKGHVDPVWGVTVTPDGQTIVSASDDRTLMVWDLVTGKCKATLPGHADAVVGVAVTPDGQTIVSASDDRTLMVWDLATGKCKVTLEGHADAVVGVAVTPDGQTIVSASDDRTLRVWVLSQPDTFVENSNSDRYTNAKVVLVGETGVGKTGLALRLCEDRWVPTESTHGMIISRLELPSAAGEEDMEREVWLWDFAGQADYRLIHQLYLDEAALGVLVFNPQDDNPFEGMGYWEKALCAATNCEPAKLLVAARCDRGGITISDKRFEEYVREHGFAGFFCTGAKSGEGCEELKEAIAKNIPWVHLPWTATSRLFKTLKDAIIKLSEEKAPLVRLPELRQRLQLLLPEQTIAEADLRAVVGLMQGQGVVQALSFGDFLLLQPAWINRYASVVVRMAREHADEMGVVLEQRVLDGKLDYKDMERLSEADEKILLRAIVQTFLDRSLCLRPETPQGTMLVFPSYFRRDKLDLPEHPNVFITYGFSGPLEKIYATLVVRLGYSDGFKSDQLWKDAADFRTPGGKRVGLAMTKKAEGAAEIIVYFEAGVPDDTKVTFIKYVHEHLLAWAQPREEVTRVRTYVCPHCDEPLENSRAIQIRLSKGLKDIGCPVCETRVTLLDLIEEKFASSEFLQKVRKMDMLAGINLDNESRELILVGHAIAIAAEAGQIFRPVTWADWGIDGDIEFKDAEGKASGRRVYLQLKSGDSYLYQRKRDDVEVFTIKNARHADYWLKQAYPVMLVIRTSDGRIRWMNVTDYLQEHGKDTKQIIFQGEPFTALNVVRRRDELMQN